MRGYVERLVIPEYLGGKPILGNIVQRSIHIDQQYRLLFGNLWPDASEYMLRMYHIPGVYVNYIRLWHLRRQAALFSIEDYIRHRQYAKMFTRRKVSDIIDRVNEKPLPRINQNTITFTRHHILPQSRDGTDDPTNIAFLEKNIHNCHHSLFANLVIEEQVIVIRMLHNPFQRVGSGYLEEMRLVAKNLHAKRGDKKPKMHFSKSNE
jgi:hypothetical protein